MDWWHGLRKKHTRKTTSHHHKASLANQVNEQATTQFSYDYTKSRYMAGSDEDRYWRSLSGNGLKDVTPETYQELHHKCYEAYNSNPLAFAIIELTTSFVLGEGLTIAAAHPDVQTTLNKFWHNPENRMDERVYNLCTELSLYGEQFIRFFVNRYNGSVIIRQIDPSLIDQIETNPDDIEKPLRYHLMSLPNSSQHPDGQWLQASQDILHITINNVSNMLRGHSDLATLLPWLRRYKDWLTDRVRINKYKSAFLWEVTLTGADRKTVDRKKLEMSAPPEPGTVIIHNEAEKWSAVEPHIQANDVSADGRAIKLMIAAGASLPEHYLADGDYGNRATAAEMSLPTMLKFKRRQRIVRYMLHSILDRVIVEAQQVGLLAREIDTHYEIVFPEIDTGTHQTLAQSVHTLTQALVTAHTQGWISNETAMQMFFKFAGEEINIHEELQRITKQSPS